jgi:hypothetical protein
MRRPLDYFLRDGLSLGYLSRAAVDDVLAHLQAWDGMIVVTDIDVARRLGDAFIAEDKGIWCAVQEVGWYAVMAVRSGRRWRGNCWQSMSFGAQIRPSWSACALPDIPKCSAGSRCCARR